MRPVTVTTVNASGGAKSSPVIPPDIYISPFQVTLDAEVTGTANYDVQYTNDDVFAVGFVAASAHWKSITAMTGSTTDAESTLISPVRGIRLIQNSGSGSVTLIVTQAGGI